MPKGLLIVISGPSGVGKGTLIELLMKQVSTLSFSVSATTRQPRPGEQEGVHYFFLSKQQFEKQIEKNEFLEWAKVHKDYYGTPKKFVQEQLEKGLDLVLDIDVQGGSQVKRLYPDAVTIFVTPPSWEELRRRLEGRHTEQQRAIESRLRDAKQELEALKSYDYLTVNTDIAKSVADLSAIIHAEKCKVTRRLEEIKNALSTH